MHREEPLELLRDEPLATGTDDVVRRRAFIRVVASRLACLHDFREAFVLALDGPWGSGVTSTLRMLREELRSRDPPCLAVEFNAWREQERGLLWWRLVETVHLTGLKESGLLRSLVLRWDAMIFRVRLSWTRVVTFGVGFALFLILAMSAAAGRLGTAAAVVGAAAAVVAIVGGVSGLAHSLSPGAPGAVETFVRRGSQDPMTRLERRYEKLANRLQRPVVVLVDDLDRCVPQAVVGLLDGIRRAIGSIPVIYVIGGDFRRLLESYVSVHTVPAEAAASASFGEPFARIFDLVVRQPDIPPASARAWWEGGISADAPAPAPDVPAPAPTTEEEALVRHRLAPLAPLLDRDPGALKRLVNAYAFEKALSSLNGNDAILEQAPEKLALWLIIRLRWPLLADALRQRPELVDELKKGLPLELGSESALGDSRSRLFQELQRIVCGGGLPGIELDAAAIAAFG